MNFALAQPGRDATCFCMDHQFLKCDCGECDVCVWECRACTVCEAIEGTLPTDCPGHRIDADRQDAIFSREVDYIDGSWRALDACGRRVLSGTTDA